MVRSGSIEFYMDREVRDAIESRTGERPPRPFETRTAFCNPTPGTVPSLGDYTDPVTGEACFLELPGEWKTAYLNLLLDTNLRNIRLEGRMPPPGYQPKPPYYVRYAGPSTSGEFIEAGPFADDREAFDYGGARYGGLAPSVGHVEVVDSEGWVAIIT